MTTLVRYNLLIVHGFISCAVVEKLNYNIFYFMQAHGPINKV